MRLVVVGATGAVGTVMMDILEERDFPADEIIPVASPRSAGRKLDYQDRQLEVVALDESVFDGADLALFDVPDELSAQWAPVAVRQGAIAIDNSGAFRMDDDVPLVVPEVNPRAVEQRPRGIIASPNCTTLAMVVPLAALHRAAGVERLVLASYQAASGAGRPGSDELWDQTEVAAKNPDDVREGKAGRILEGGEYFVHPIAMNVVPRCGSVKEDGYTSEELKLGNETRKIMDLPDLEVTATCVRVPVVVGHGVAVHARFGRAIDVDEARSLLSSAPGVELVDDLSADVYPTPLEAAGKDACFVGRIRRDLHDERALAFFCVADNLRKGAALNTVQVAELLVR
ncbi:MAG TPA: aspartate-semialdehyde dehydrogenase [Actinomycetota bacterium]|nr:aspartate-semialdehyde dehydrogenase [Actinomycetota bacterium]